MRKNLKLLLSVLLLLVVFVFSGCGDSTVKKEDAQKVLGEIWEGLKAGNQEPYNTLKDKALEVSVAIVNPTLRLQAGGASDGGKKAVEALTILESVSLSGPQKIVIMMTPEEMAAIQVDKESPVVWGTFKTTVAGSLYENRSGAKDLLTLGLAQDAASIKLSKDEMWPIPVTMWEKLMLNKLKSLSMSTFAYYVRYEKLPENLDIITEYGYSHDPALKVEYTPGQVIDRIPNFVAVVFSLDGKYKMTLDYPKSDFSSLKAVPVE